MMFWYGGHWVFWQAVLMWIGMLAFWGLVAWAMFAAVRCWPAGRGSAGESRGQARRLLDMRLARGEISIDEYRQLRDLIDDTCRSDPAGGHAGGKGDGDGRSRAAA